ncbi:hypothetical protein IFM12275_15070 [Nocardia sputorum]|nr:hypothetical protein IFM12275_15070 [Nocardia sputorum]
MGRDRLDSTQGESPVSAQSLCADHIIGIFGKIMFHTPRAMSMICIHIGDIITALTSSHSSPDRHCPLRNHDDPRLLVQWFTNF